jgi:hypothetical protein
LERVKRVLFQPFDLGKWFIIGFCAWLAFLGDGGENMAGWIAFGQAVFAHLRRFPTIKTG